MNQIISKVAMSIGSRAVIALVAYILLSGAMTANASAPSGLPATVATTSVETLSTTALTLFATSTCAARIITTSGQAIMLTFSDNQGAVPTGSFGTLQAASTTVVYDSGHYGCGAVKGYSFASQALTLVESR